MVKMDNWRNTIINRFAPHVSKLNIVADPDQLFIEEKLVVQLNDKGFDIIEFKDPIEFRFFYETSYRDDTESKNDLILIVSGNQALLDQLPYDLLSVGKIFHFGLSEIFPNLNYPVLTQIHIQHLDILFNAQKLNQERMGENATKDFILRHVYKIPAELISTNTDLLQMLLRLHYNNLEMPEILSRRLIDVIDAHGKFENWPLEEILVDDKAFYAFLQERWPVFLDTLEAESNQIGEDFSHYGFKFKGPGILPFGHEDILVYIDNLFVERKLQPVENNNAKTDLTPWIKCGVMESEEKPSVSRLTRLLEILEKQLPSEESRHSDWISFALKKSEFEALNQSMSDNFKDFRWDELKIKIENKFSEWLAKHFSSLVNLPPVQPVMLHHTPKQMVRCMEEVCGHRVALIVVDGLSLDQWITVRENLRKQINNFAMRETAVFAWIPSLTSVSRQALFSGKPPFYFPDSIHTTHNEKSLWQQFWENYGLSRFDIGYKKSLGSGDPTAALDDLNLKRVKALGLVIDTVDKIMHGMQLGNAGMHDQIRLWCQSGYLSSLINLLQKNDFQVWLTSDHGNIECKGIGSPGEGVIAETRGERVRVYPTHELRSQVADHYPGTTLWDQIGLPEGYYPLLAQGTNAFTTKGKRTVTHGGASIEEVIVPLIKFEK